MEDLKNKNKENLSKKQAKVLDIIRSKLNIEESVLDEIMIRVSNIKNYDLKEVKNFLNNLRDILKKNKCFIEDNNRFFINFLVKCLLLRGEIAQKIMDEIKNSDDSEIAAEQLIRNYFRFSSFVFESSHTGVSVKNLFNEFLNLHFPIIEVNEALKKVTFSKELEETPDVKVRKPNKEAVSFSIFNSSLENNPVVEYFIDFLRKNGVKIGKKICSYISEGKSVKQVLDQCDYPGAFEQINNYITKLGSEKVSDAVRKAMVSIDNSAFS